jgi:hypothetical protein
MARNRGVLIMGKILTNKMVEGYLTDCLGYDEMMIDELKEGFKPLKSALSEEEKEDCINYYA